MGHCELPGKRPCLNQGPAAIRSIRTTAGFAEQAATFAETKAEIHRYLWVLGGSLVAILSSLYILAETWSRG